MSYFIAYPCDTMPVYVLRYCFQDYIFFFFVVDENLYLFYIIYNSVVKFYYDFYF